MPNRKVDLFVSQAICLTESFQLISMLEYVFNPSWLDSFVLVVNLAYRNVIQSARIPLVRQRDFQRLVFLYINSLAVTWKVAQAVRKNYRIHVRLYPWIKNIRHSAGYSLKSFEKALGHRQLIV